MKIVKFSIFALTLGLLAACHGSGSSNGKDSVAPVKQEDYTGANSSGAGPDTAKTPVNSSGTGTAGHDSPPDTGANSVPVNVSGGSTGATQTGGHK
jgi:hypothetical protein